MKPKNHQMRALIETKKPSSNEVFDEAMQFDEAMHGVSTKYQIEQKETTIKTAKGETTLQPKQIFAKQPETIHIEHRPLENDEEDLCLIERTQNSEQSKSETAEQIGNKKREGEGEELLGSSYNISEESEDDMSDMEVEDLDLDLEDILEAERSAGIVEEEDFVGEYERRTFGNSHHTYSSTIPDKDMDTTPRPRPSFETTRPAGPSTFIDPNYTDEDNDEEIAVIPKINGVEVEMIEVDLAQPEIDFYMDVIYGRWRVRDLSRLRRCWMPIDTLDC